MASRKHRRTPPDAPVIGWREWISLPELGIDRIKAKIDTGARSSAIHAVGVERFERDDEPWIRFGVQPLQRRNRPQVAVESRLHDERWVRNSGGGRELRPVLLTEVGIGSYRWSIELTLTDRQPMGFRFLLGRQAIRGRALIDPGSSYRIGRKAAPSAPGRQE